MNRMIWPSADGDFLEERFEAIFEFAAIFCAGDHGAEVHGDEPFVLERLGDVTADNAPRESFDDGGFADAGFADEDRIVFGAPRQHLHHAADFVIAPDDWIDFSLARGGGEVAAVFFERLKFVLGIWIGHTLVSTQFAHNFENVVTTDFVGLEKLLESRAAFIEQAEEEMLGAEVFIFHPLGFLAGGIEGTLEMVAQEKIAGTGAADFDAAIQFAGEFGGKLLEIRAEALQELRDEAVILLNECEKQMLAIDFLMGAILGERLRGLKRSLRLHGELVRLHNLFLSGGKFAR